jgi:hypothetical protein
MASKFDQFIEADNSIYPARLTLEISAKFGKWGEFHVDNADIILHVSKLENIAPELLAVTWLNETTFRFYSEPNKNNSSMFEKWDVGPMQLNVGYTWEDLRVQFFSDKNIDVLSAFGQATDLFSGNPMANIRIAARKLNALGRAEIIGSKNGQKFQMFPKVDMVKWKTLPEQEKNLRRAVLYTGPEARPSRLTSYNYFAPMFKKFFEIYSK